MQIDAVTFSGTGEPTLAANLGEALDAVREWPTLEQVPTVVLTNASLMPRADVRRDLARAHLVVAKLDAPDRTLFHVINRPIAGCSWDEVLESICVFRQEFGGRLALQMMFIAANRRRAAEMAELARSLNADEIQLNTPLRPSSAPPLSRRHMAVIEEAFVGLPVVSVYEAHPPEVMPLDAGDMRRRRPAEGHPEIVGREVG
jgi:wyosine [tRNA(Phe)-imidazoG37] synthetase (radical SAM superfamily)